MAVDHLLVLQGLMQAMDFPEVLPPRPEWMADGACLERPDVQFFPTRGEDSGPAKAVCARCLVRDECLDWALQHGEKGVWGGTSERERRRLVRLRRAAKAA